MTPHRPARGTPHRARAAAGILRHAPRSLVGLGAGCALLASACGDAPLVSQAAYRIAEHPTVPPEQMATIQSVLGEEFAAFAQMDREVHDAAAALSALADGTRPLPELFDGYVRIQNGCLSCHAAFRARVSEALVAAEGS